ncbi:uncharacterized protein C8Q71DRAFT_697968 [Rhodofomes roseus]|uniref:Uncharacterized protein n=1 Tax=Rhodofomes roseus TaxID=34475 RepID=A0ABQ8KXJ0_9APHY|nr:uncharacterized protein C8Q71DRAFT_697968 [Rhodofomes roseus]KAH9843486.1 hypothetical protein C8Q71DRAFT_697968 [Rhodofomes roseus]
MWPFSQHSPEREYVSLMYKTTACYASWDPLRPVHVGDFGRLQDDGSFAPHGNIFAEGLAGKYKIEKHTQGQDKLRYVVSNNGKEVSVAPDVDISLESIVEGHIKHKVTFSKGRGALLAMLKPRLTTVTYPGRLSRLLADREWSDFVLVSEAYTCRSYARLLTSTSSKEVTVGLGASLPVAAAAGVPVNVGGDIDVHWHTDAHSGDWKCAHHEPVMRRGVSSTAEEDKLSNEENGSEPLCYPLFKLVAIRRPFGSPVSTVRAFDFELPNVVPPWMKDPKEEKEEAENNDATIPTRGEEVPEYSWRDLFKSLTSWICSQVSAV